MTDPRAPSPFRRALFLILIVAVAGVLGWFGRDWLGGGGLPMVTYFSESVEGLEVGAPVKMRGAPVGVVTRIRLSPDPRWVAVEVDLDRGQAGPMGYRRGEGGGAWQASAGLRAQLVRPHPEADRFLRLETVGEGAHPPPVLAFETPPSFVPAIPSPVEASRAGGGGAPGGASQLPERFEELAARLSRAIEDADVAGLSSSARGLMTKLDGRLDELDAPVLSNKTQTALDSVARAADAFAKLVEEKSDSGGGGGGLFSTISSVGLVARTATNAIEDAKIGETTQLVRDSISDVRVLARETHQLMGEVYGMMVAVQQTLNASTAMLGMIERDPGVFLRGRAPESKLPVPGAKPAVEEDQ